MKPIDFSTRESFPGTNGNPFDVVLHRISDLERLPAPLFTALLLLLSLPTTIPHWAETVFLYGFILVDWILLAALPRAGKSYGPAKPIVLILAIPRMLFSLLPLPFALALQGIGTALVVYGFWIEPHTIHVTHQTLQSPKLPADFHLKMLHLGDLHLERVTGREKQLNRLVAELQPDLILFSGDFLNLSYLRDPQAWEAVRQVVGEWQAPLGVYAVSGSPAVDLEDIIPAKIAGLPLHYLAADHVSLKHQGQTLYLFGLSCTHKPHVDAPRLRALLDGAAPTAAADHFSILLYHTPDLAPDAGELGFDLQLSGHTHGGQIRLPVLGALFTGSLYGKTFEAGRMKINGMDLYITRGIGMEGAGAPRVRFNCPPEIILWDITGNRAN